MIAVGIDVSKGKSKVAVLGERKKVIKNPYDVQHNKSEMSKFVSEIEQLGDGVHAVMEHTGVYYKVVAEELHKAGIRVSVVNPVYITQFGNNTLRKVKTDKKDAMKIARYTLENHEELFPYETGDETRDMLKSVVRQFNFESKTLTAHKNHLKALLERVFPGIDDVFTSPAKPNGHQKWVDFVIEFWHNDCVSQLSESKFIEKYRKFCKKNRYIFNEQTVKEIHAKSRNNLTTMKKNDVTKLLVEGAAKRILRLSEDVEILREKMNALAKMLPEYETVISLFGVGETLAPQLIGEIGDVRRFASKWSLVAFAGVDPDKNDSGKKVTISGSVSRRGDSLLRKTVYQVVEKHLLNSPKDEAAYQFLDKKRKEGKNFYVYMTAACNKFLRIYYGRVSDALTAIDNENNQVIAA
jgi:transposase